MSEVCSVRRWIEPRFSRSLSQAIGAFWACFLQAKLFLIHNKEFIPGLFLFCTQYFSSGSTLAKTMGCDFVVIPANEVNSFVFQLMIITQLYAWLALAKTSYWSEFCFAMFHFLNHLQEVWSWWKVTEQAGSQRQENHTHARKGSFESVCVCVCACVCCTARPPFSLLICHL